MESDPMNESPPLNVATPPFSEPSGALSTAPRLISAPPPTIKKLDRIVPPLSSIVPVGQIARIGEGPLTVPPLTMKRPLPPGDVLPPTTKDAPAELVNVRCDVLPFKINVPTPLRTSSGG